MTTPLMLHIAGKDEYCKPAAQEANYLAGLACIAAHVQPNGDDEIRGQIVSGCSNPSTYCSSISTCPTAAGCPWPNTDDSAFPTSASAW